MGHIIICNTGSDSISKFNTETLELKKLDLTIGEKPFGPHEVSIYGKNILIANSYNNTISIIDFREFKEIKNLYIGAHPNDIVNRNEKIYVACGESNSIITYDIKKEQIEFEIPTGRFPHHIELFDQEELAFVSNMGEDNISVINCRENKEIKKIKVGKIPIKNIISNNRKFLFVVVSKLGQDKKGLVVIISLKKLEIIDKFEVGFGPVDIYEHKGFLYVSNFCDNSISVINLKNLKEEEKYMIEGMPRGIIKDNTFLYVGDYLMGKLNIIDIKNRNKKNIAIGKEPNAMIFIEN